jgi:hypothetical protein
MGGRTRIRWINVARLAAGAVASAALVLGVPALLERPKPPPLPDDIGLTQAREAPPAVVPRAPAASRTERRRTRSRDHKPLLARTNPEPHHQEAHRSHEKEPAGQARPTVAASPASAAPPAPAPPPPTSPPAYVSPAPAPVATSSPSPPASSSPGGAAQTGEPSEFGFER